MRLDHERRPGGSFRIVGGTPLLLLVSLVIFLDSVGYGVVVPVLPIYARTLGVSDFGNGFLFATYAIALFLGAIPAGMLSDRFGRKPFILFGMFAMSAAFVFYAFATSYLMLVVARVMDGLTAAATWSAGLALLGDRFESREMGAKMGYAIGAMAVGGIAGPLLGGVLSDAIGYRAPFFAIAGACFAGGAAALFLTEDRGSRQSSTPALKMLKTVLANRTILLACLITLVTTTGLGLLEPTLPIYLREQFSMSRTAIGIVFGVTMALYAVASPLAGRLSDRLGRKSPILVGLIATAAITPLIAVFKSEAAVFVLMGLLGVTITLFETPSVPLVTDAMPGGAGAGEVHYGTAFGMLNLFWSLGYALGPLLGGAIMGWTGLLAALSVYSALLVGLAALVAVYLETGRA
jgi:MFS transporter, DHA1 family, solute carrier family 18 (vesicular amine transporter), member 1/2